MANFPEAKVKILAATMLAFYLVLGAIEFPLALKGIGSSMWPAGAVNYIKSHHLEDHIFNFYTWGGFMIYEGVPPFIDGRADIYYPLNIFTDYLKATGLKTKPEKILDKYHIKTVLYPKNTALTVYLENSPGWQEVYKGKKAVIFVRKPAL